MGFPTAIPKGLFPVARLLPAVAVAVVSLAVSAAGGWISAQPPDPESSPAGFQSRLETIVAECRAAGMSAELAATEKLLETLLHRDPRRQYIFLPDGNWLAGFPDGRQPDPDWLEKTSHVRRDHAAAMFAAARGMDADQPAAAIWQSLHEILYWDPDHAAARRVLGHRGEPGKWETVGDRIRTRRTTGQHALMNWNKGEWIQVQTDHFTISSTAGEEETLRLAGLAERWRWVWQQVFFDFWSSAGSLARTLQDDSVPRINRKRFEIILFPDHASYVAQLQERVPGVANSTGYYSDQQRVSFFFVGDDQSLADTWRHELTHQMFQESVSARPGVFDDGWLWLGEGIAMYMESLQEAGPYVTLGGFDAGRLQYSRIRRFRERFFVPTAELSALSLASFQKRTDVRNLYSQSSGITQMLMTSGGGRWRDGLIGFLRLLYAGRVRNDAFARLVGLEFSAIDGAYDAFLAVEADEVRKFLLDPESVDELALPRVGSATPLDDGCFASIARCRNLMWLDLSGQPLEKAGMEQLAGCTALRQLFLRGCTLGRDAELPLAAFLQLEELDLAESRVGDRVIDVLARMPKLTSVDLTGSSVSQAAITRLKQAKPGLTVRNQ